MHKSHRYQWIKILILHQENCQTKNIVYNENFQNI
jgi:hypothetical protein